MSTVQLQTHHEAEAAVKRVEDVRLLEGEGSFVDDMHPVSVGYMGIVRSSYPHAVIKKIDFSKAEQSHEFIAGITGEDLKGQVQPLAVNPRQRPAPRFHLAIGKTRFVGEAVAAFVVKSKYAVEDVMELVEVEYEPLPTVLTIEDAKKGSTKVYNEWEDNVCFRYALKKGDAASAITNSNTIIRARIGIKRQEGVPIEPRSVVAYYDKGTETYHVSSTTQAAHRVRDSLSAELKVAPDKVRVTVKDMGGGFGTKGAQTYPEPLIACLLSKKTGIAIKWTSTRTEDLMETAAGRDVYCDLELACNQDGKLTALRARGESDAGVSGTLSIQVALALNLSVGAYKVPNIDLEGVTYVTNKTALGPVRGSGRPEGCFFIERAMDILARKLSLDPAELRARNLIQPSEMPYETGTGFVYDSGDFPQILEKLLAGSDYAGLKKWRDEVNSDSNSDKVAGVGLCVQVEDTGGLGKESAKVSVTEDGRIRIWTGSMNHGQGHETTYAQVAAKEFGVPMEKVSVFWGDTSSLPWGIGTFGSRSMAVGGSSVLDACRKVKSELINRASEISGVPANQLSIERGNVIKMGAYAQHGSRTAAAQEVIMSLSSLIEKTGPVEATSDYNAKGTPFATAGQLCALTIDRKTGMVHIGKFIVVDDCGVVINPMIVDGQLHGGVICGIGGSLYEEVIYNEEGQLLTSNFLDYTIPTAVEIPDEMKLIHMETPSPVTLNGAKGVGETGTIGAYPAVFNALNDALAAAGSKTELNLAPAFPETIFRALKSES